MVETSKMKKKSAFMASKYFTNIIKYEFIVKGFLFLKKHYFSTTFIISVVQMNIWGIKTHFYIQYVSTNEPTHDKNNHSLPNATDPYI